MMKNNGCCNKGAHFLMALSVIALILAAVVSLFKVEMWLAGTQWILVSILLAIYALIAGIHGSSCATGKQE